MDCTATGIQEKPVIDQDLFLENGIFHDRNPVELTGREKEVLLLVLEGKTNKEIAQNLCRVERTVEYHRNSLMRKFQVRNYTQLIKKAIAMGIVSV